MAVITPGASKQLLRLMDEGSLFQIAVNRLNGILSLERIFVVTVADLAHELKEQCLRFRKKISS